VKSGDRWLRRYVESQHLQGCSLHICRLRTDGLGPREQVLNVSIAAGDMGPVSLVAGYQHKLVFSPLPRWLLWERSWVRTRGPVSHRAEGCVRSPSS
jgi:hypothetical protein